jgi:hypothetical protein
MANFAQKHEKHENSSIPSQTTSKTPAPSTTDPSNDVAQVYMSPPTSNNAISQSPTLTTSASSSVSSPTQYPSGHEKSAPLHAVFKSQAPNKSPAPISIVTALKTRSELAGFMENHQKFEKTRFFTQNPLVSGNLRLEDIVNSSLSSSTIVATLKTRSVSTGFAENCQKVKKSPTFVQKAPESIISAHSKCAYNISTPTGPTAIILYFETLSESARFTQKRLKTRILSIVFNQNYPKSSVSGRFNSTDALPTPSIAPTKHPCNLSGDFNGFSAFSQFLDLFS